MSKYWNYDFWFNLRPEPLAGAALWALIGFCVLLLVVAIILRFFKKKFNLSQKILNYWRWFLVINCLVGLAWGFFNYEITPIFAAKFWSLLWLILGIAWLWRILWQIKQNQTVLMSKNNQRAQEIKKYLP